MWLYTTICGSFCSRRSICSKVVVQIKTAKKKGLGNPSQIECMKCIATGIALCPAYAYCGSIRTSYTLPGKTGKPLLRRKCPRFLPVFTSSCAREAQTLLAHSREVNAPPEPPPEPVNVDASVKERERERGVWSSLFSVIRPLDV